MTNNINDLVKKLMTAKDAYYNGKPIMSDAEYDALEDHLRKIDPANAFFGVVGASPTGGKWPKVKHSTPMGSLGKAQEMADMEAWYAGLPNEPELLISEKLDGISLNLRYENRKLVQALTRGDGTIGEDITRNVALMQGVLKMLPTTMPDGTPTPDLVFIRGEIILLHTDFETGFPVEHAKWVKGEGSNPRNSASGTAKRQSDADQCRYLTVKTYQYLPNGMATLPSKEDEFEALLNAGFSLPTYMVCSDLKGVEDLYKQYIDKARAELNYDIDGLVIEINNTQAREFMGEHNGKPKGAIAFKFPHEEQITTLRNVRWQVGNSGRITPVAEFDMVTLAGAQVKQASLHNISNMIGLVHDAGFEGFPRQDDKILVARRNDVIPYVESILSQNQDANAVQFTPPNLCPACGTVLERDGEYLVCRGEDCPAQIAGSIKRWVKKIGVLNVGDSFIEALIDAGMIEDIADLYLLDPAEVVDIEIGGRRAGGIASKALRNLEAKKSLPLHVFIGALGIPLIGRTMAKTIIDGGINSMSKMAKAHISEVAAIPGVGSKKAQAFVLGFNNKLPLIGKLLAQSGITIQTISGPLVGKSFCFTGFRDGDLEAAIEKAGGTMKSGVSKDLTYLVAADPTSTSGKALKARSYGTKVIGVDEAKNLAGVV